MKNNSSMRIALRIGSVTGLLFLACGVAATGVSRADAASRSEGNGGLHFFNSSDPETNPFPQWIAVADFNGDGKPDLAVATYSIFTSFTDVNILLGNGDGSFTAGPTFPATGQNINNVVVADFNGDGKPDLAISMPDANEIQVLLGDGDGSFTPLPAISAVGVSRIFAGHFTANNKADLVVVSAGPGTVTVLLGNGNGTFTAKAPIMVAGDPAYAAVGDFNGDGKQDLAVVNYLDDTLTILLGNGKGAFKEVESRPSTGIEPLCVAVGDFNGDGIPDLAVTNQNNGYPEPGTVTVLIGRGNGTFTPMAVSPVLGSVPESVAVADFNGDGILDLATSNSGSNTISVLLGRGNGTFSAPLNPAAGTNPIFTAVADFNGDGVPDLAAADNVTSSVTVLLTQRSH